MCLINFENLFTSYTRIRSPQKRVETVWSKSHWDMWPLTLCRHHHHHHQIDGLLNAILPKENTVGKPVHEVWVVCFGTSLR